MQDGSAWKTCGLREREGDSVAHLQLQQQRTVLRGYVVLFEEWKVLVVDSGALVLARQVHEQAPICQALEKGLGSLLGSLQKILNNDDILCVAAKVHQSMLAEVNARLCTSDGGTTPVRGTKRTQRPLGRPRKCYLTSITSAVSGQNVVCGLVEHQKCCGDWSTHEPED